MNEMEEPDPMGTPIGDSGPPGLADQPTAEYGPLVTPNGGDIDVDADTDTPLPPLDRQFTILHLLGGVLAAASLFCIVFAVVAKSGGTLLLALLLSAITTLFGLRLFRGSLEDAEERVIEELDLELDRTPSRQLKPAILRLKGERLLWETRLHPLSIFWWWVLLGASIVGAVFLGVRSHHWGVALGLWLAAMVPIGTKIYEWWHSTVGVTDRRLIAVQGVYRIKRPMMPLARLTDESVEIPFISWVLGRLRIIKTKYGSLIVESAGQDQALSRIDFFPALEPVNQIIAGQAVPGSSDGS